MAKKSKPEVTLWAQDVVEWRVIVYDDETRTETTHDFTNEKSAKALFAQTDSSLKVRLRGDAHWTAYRDPWVWGVSYEGSNGVMECAEESGACYGVRSSGPKWGIPKMKLHRRRKLLGPWEEVRG